jgi:hypothetical protein
MRNSNIEPLSVVNEEPVSLIFTKDKAPSWFINIWSNPDRLVQDHPRRGLAGGP